MGNKVSFKLLSYWTTQLCLKFQLKDYGNQAAIVHHHNHRCVQQQADFFFHNIIEWFPLLKIQLKPPSVSNQLYCAYAFQACTYTWITSEWTSQANQSHNDWYCYSSSTTVCPITKKKYWFVQLSSWGARKPTVKSAATHHQTSSCAWGVSCAFNLNEIFMKFLMDIVCLCCCWSNLVHD